MKMIRLGLFTLLAITAAGAQGEQKNLPVDESPMALEYGVFFEDMAARIDAIDAELMRAESAKAAAIGVVRFAYAMRDLREKAEALDNKYPQAKGEMPPKLRAKSERFSQAIGQLGRNGLPRVNAKYGNSAEMKFAMRQLKEFANTKSAPPQN